MTINVNDIKIYQSQDNTDNDSGGGSRTSTEIIDGDINNLFPDISRVDTVSGDVALRKIFPTIFTPNRDVYYGAHSIIRKKPSDPKVSALLFYTNDSYDKRIDAKNAIESYVVASYIESFYLFGDHVLGSKTVTFLQTLSQEPPVIGEVYLMIDPDNVEQYIRITDMDLTNIILSYDNNGTITDYKRRRIICEIEQPLTTGFEGSYFKPTGQTENSTTTYATQIADAAKFYGTRNLGADVLSTESEIIVDSIYETLVPSITSRSPLVNQDAVSPSNAILTTGRTVSFRQDVTEGADIDIGLPVTPDTLDIDNLYTDNGLGQVIDGSDVVKGEIDYSTGLITENTIPSFNRTISFIAGMKAESFLQFTGSIKIDNSNQGLVFVKNVSPLPSLGSINIDYRSQGKWYRITGNYDSTIGGSSLGSGNVNDNLDGTGTLSLTLGSLPDIDSDLVISWGSAGIMTDRYTGVDTDYEVSIHKTLHPNINPSTLSIVIKNSFDTVGTITSDANGVLSDTIGTVTGLIDLPTGELYITDHTSGATRFPSVNDPDPVTIDYNYAEPGVAEPGNYKQTIINEGDFITIDRTLNDYTFNIGESVIVESVHLYFDIVYSDAAFINGYYNSMRTSKISLFTDTGGVLRSAIDRTVSWGSVAANGDVVLTLENAFISKPTPANDLFTLTPRYVLTDTQSKLEPNVSVLVNYRVSAPLSYPLSVSLSDSMENLFDIKILLPGFISGEIGFSAFTKTSRTLDQYNYVSRGVGVFSRDTGLQVGVVDKNSGVVELNYTNPIDFGLNVYSISTSELLEEEEGNLVYDFKTASTKIVPSSLQLRYYTSNQPGVLQTATTDVNGDITGDSISFANSYVDTETGMVHIEFTSTVFLSTIKYDAVAETSLPVDPDLLGLNPIRLPRDGRVPIFENGRHVIIFDEATTTVVGGTPVADQVDTLARSGQSYIEVIDDNGKRLDPDQYISDRVAGTVTFNNPLVLEDKYGTALTAPYYIVDRVEDMLLAIDVQVTGDIKLSAELTHDYTADNSKVASALVWGDTGSRVKNDYFTQEIWNNGDPVWQDAIDGDTTTAQYDAINYPIQIDNQSSASGRWAIIFTSATTVKVAHEKLGVVAADFSISIEDVAPINPATGSPYFVMDKQGFGSGWVTNNVIRINTESGDNNMWVIRTVQSGALTEETDNIEIEIRGDAN